MIGLDVGGDSRFFTGNRLGALSIGIGALSLVYVLSLGGMEVDRSLGVDAVVGRYSLLGSSSVTGFLCMGSMLGNMSSDLGGSYGISVAALVGIVLGIDVVGALWLGWVSNRYNSSTLQVISLLTSTRWCVMRWYGRKVAKLGHPGCYNMSVMCSSSVLDLSVSRVVTGLVVDTRTMLVLLSPSLGAIDLLSAWSSLASSMCASVVWLPSVVGMLSLFGSEAVASLRAKGVMSLVVSFNMGSSLGTSCLAVLPSSGNVVIISSSLVDVTGISVDYMCGSSVMISNSMEGVTVTNSSSLISNIGMDRSSNSLLVSVSTRLSSNTGSNLGSSMGLLVGICKVWLVVHGIIGLTSMKGLSCRISMYVNLSNNALDVRVAPSIFGLVKSTRSLVSCSELLLMNVSLLISALGVRSVTGIVINVIDGAILSSCLSTCCLFGCYRYCLPYAASLLGATEGLLIINQFDSVAAPSSIMGLKQSLVSNPVLGINGNRVVLGSRLVTSMKWHDLRGVTDLSIGISINSNMSISISISSDSGSEVIPVTCNVIEGALDSIDGIVTMGQRLVSVIGATSMNGLRCVSCLHGSMCVMSGTVGCFSVGSLLDRLEGSTIGSVGSGIIGKELGILGIVVESVKVIDDIGAYTVGILNVEVKVTIGSTLVTDMGVNGILGSMDVIECIEVGSVVSVEVVGATRGIMVEGVKCIRSVLYTGMALEVSEVIRSTEGVRVTNINSTGIVGN